MSFASFMKNQKTAIATAATTNATVNFANATGISLPMMASTLYRFQFDIIWQSTATGVGIGFGVNGPASPTFVLVRTEIPTSLTAITQGMQRAYDTGTATGAIDQANANCFAKCYGFVSNGTTAGDLVLRFKSSAATQVSIRAGTMGRMWRVNPSN